MPCLKPILIRNPRYRPNKKNGGVPPPLVDDRDEWLLVPCGKCFGCRRRKQSDWRFRMLNEFKYSDDRKFHFVTFTFSNDSLNALHDEFPDLSTDRIIIVAVRRFLERYRKLYKVSLRHLFVTELGENTSRIHLHGIICGCRCGSYHRGRWRVDIPALRSIWSYGHVWVGWCSEASISYVVKYMLKSTDDFKPQLFVSPGLGKKYVDYNKSWHHSTPLKNWYCVTSSGHKIAIPRYYKLKLFTPEELEYRKLYLWEFPPDYVFQGVNYGQDQASYDRAVHVYYLETLRLGLSFNKK